METQARIKTKMNEIWIDNEGILMVKPLEGVEIDLEEAKICFDVYKNLGVGPHNKVLELIDVREGSLTREARDYVAEVGKDYFIAAAVISDSLAVRLLVNFFVSFSKNEVPFKMFANEVEARKWLRTFK